MQQNGLIVTDEMEDAMRSHEEKGQTAVLIGINGELRYLFKRRSVFVNASSSHSVIPSLALERKILILLLLDLPLNRVVCNP